MACLQGDSRTRVPLFSESLKETLICSFSVSYFPIRFHNLKTHIPFLILISAAPQITPVVDDTFERVLFSYIRAGSSPGSRGRESGWYRGKPQETRGQVVERNIQAPARRQQHLLAPEPVISTYLYQPYIHTQSALNSLFSCFSDATRRLSLGNSASS